MKGVSRICFCLLLLSVVVRGRTVVGDTASPSGGLVPSPAPAGRLTTNLGYAAAPVDNPLKGFTCAVPRAGSATDYFPHSVLSSYFPLRDTMTGPASFDWTQFEAILSKAAKDHSQLVPRFFLDYPGWTNSAIPQYLLDGGLRTTNYSRNGNRHSLMPDYEDVNLRTALTNFIRAFGRKYDGDPRVAFIQMGLLGCWGEWHCESYTKWWASLAVQREVIDAYLAAFRKTKLQIRYAAGTNNDSGAVPEFRNDNLPVGYHDDSFSGTTIGPYRWMMLREMEAAGTGAVDKWKTQPFGGEVRAELVRHSWDSPRYVLTNQTIGTNQDFDACVRTMHATYIGDWFVFSHVLNTGGTYTRSLESARKMGYELWVQSFSNWTSAGSCLAQVVITNTGVAPFYYDWPVEVAACAKKRIVRTWPTPWAISSIVPGDGAQTFTLSLTNAPSRPFTLLMRVVNPMPSGKPLRFANVNQDATLKDWLTLGVVE